jgi:LmbE family N-acetylglucosaminyl deacetylase
MLEYLRNKKIMLVVAHPDDELLGPGGTMNRLINELGCTVHVVILGEGITSRANDHRQELWKEELARHRQNILEAQSTIGFQSLNFYGFPDNRFDSVALLDIIKTVEKEKDAFSPEVIFTHHGGDVNVDHQRTFEAVVTACRPMADERVKTIITFETPSGTEWRAASDPKHFIPTVFIEISESNLQAKIRGMECYHYEKRSYPHPRSPEALKILAQKNGITVGKSYAEAFMLIRSIS